MHYIYKPLPYHFLHIGVCEPSPCYNGGTCTVVDGKASCECPTGYDGEQCENSK